MKRLRYAIALYLLSIISPLLVFSSCAQDLGYSAGGDDDSTVVVFELTDSTPGLYAMEREEEFKVSELDILLFNTKKELINEAPISGNVEIVSLRHIKISAVVRSGFYGNVMLLGNYNKALLEIPLTKGMSYDDVRALLKLELDDKWQTDTSSPGYEIPMYGETGFINVKNKNTNNFSTTLTHMLCRVDVTVADAAKQNFKLTCVRVYNRDIVGMLPTSKVNGKPYMPTTPTKVNEPLVYKDLTTDNEQIAGEIYLMESLVASSIKDTLRRSDAVCLVVGGYYTSTNNPTVYADTLYYRVDFALNESATEIYPKHYYDLLRNHRYKVNIVSVSGPGTLDPEEALDRESSYIEVEVIDWGDGGTIDGAVDGQYTLRLSQGEFILSSDVHTKDSISNKLTVSSDHPDGWYISKITEENGTTPIPSDGWLTTTLAIDAVQMTDKTFSLLLEENNTPAPRVGYIFIQSGPRMVYKLKVMQENKIKLKNIVWLDYDGISGLPENSDGDSGLTSIVVERPGLPTQTSTITQGKLMTVVQVDRATKITVTYKEYALDLPLADYTVDATSETITITNRSLIGKARHLDEIRRQVDTNGNIVGDYIQVADINLGGYTSWLPIGTTSSLFMGSYDGGSGYAGKGFKIQSLNITSTSSYTGLFGIASGSTFKRIHIASGTINGANTTAAICGQLTGRNSEISGCSNAANVTGTEKSIAGICGYGTAIISDCLNTGVIKGIDNVGGIIGQNGAATTAGGNVSNCSNTGAIYGDGNNIGGIIAKSYRSTVSKCLNSGVIQGSPTSSEYVGGICGELLHEIAIIIDCKNLSVGSVSGKGIVGGICGSNGNSFGEDGGLIEGCTNEASVTAAGSDCAGGICGFNFLGTISRSTNAAAITGKNYVGGIMGINTMEGSINTLISNCDNLAGGVIIGDTYVGGICGRSGGGGTTLRGCDNMVGNSVSGVSYVGGICGSNGSDVLDIHGNVFDFCTNSASVKGTGKNIGGIVGYNHGVGAKINDCVNNAEGETEGEENVGGICGRNAYSSLIWGSNNKAPVKGTNYIGGVCGVNQLKGELFNATNNATVKGTGVAIGGICGQSSVGIITNCKNLDGGDVEGVSYIGGVCGFNYSDISGSSNAAKVLGTSDAVAGICGQNGYLDESGSGPHIDGGAITTCTNTGAISGGGDYVAGICGINGTANSKGGQVSSCINEGTVEGASWVSGVCGDNNGVGVEISLSENKANIIGRGEYIGGICGQNNAGAIIGKCTNTGNIAKTEAGSTSAVGGICGYNNGGTIEDLCSNSGNISGTAHYIGGICGLGLNGKINNCSNSGVITGDGLYYIGGICGYNNGGEIRVGSNSGKISGGFYMGGISGYNNGATALITDCVNRATITGTGNNVGGIAGYNLTAGAKITKSRNLKGADVSGAAGVGGISGRNGNPDGLGTISYCINEAIVSGTSNSIGGICGVDENGGITLACYNIGAVNGPLLVGAIVGAGTGTTRCFYGGAASAVEANGATLFSRSEWPTEILSGWELTTSTPIAGPWKEHGKWDYFEVNITYPILAPPAP